MIEIFSKLDFEIFSSLNYLRVNIKDTGQDYEKTVYMCD